MDGYWDPFFALINSIVDNGFAHPKINELISVVNSADEVFDALLNAPKPDEQVLASHL